VLAALPCRAAINLAGILRIETAVGGKRMSAYKVISVVGTSTKSWEDATQTAVSAAAKSLRDLRIAKVVDMDVTVDKKGKITQYRCRVDLSFKYEI
jgi:dodecin